MKNIFTVLLLLVSSFVWAQDTISVSYTSTEDMFMKKIMEFQGIEGFEVNVKGTVKDMPYKLFMVRCKNGQVERKELAKDIPCEMDSVAQFYFFAQPESKDTLHLGCSYRVGLDLHIPIMTKDHILMETLPVKAYTVKDRIPLITYTSGSAIKFTFNGQTVEGISYCNVRFSKIHPSEWYQKFGLKDYFYIELEFFPH